MAEEAIDLVQLIDLVLEEYVIFDFANQESRCTLEGRSHKASSSTYVYYQKSKTKQKHQ
jgi:hypothetical protein